MWWLIVLIIIIIIVICIYNYYYSYTKLTDYENISKSIIDQAYNSSDNPIQIKNFKIYQTSGQNYYCKKQNIIYLHTQKNVSADYDKQTVMYHLIILLSVMTHSFLDPEQDSYESTVENITLNATILKHYDPFKKKDPEYTF